ncbi:hypothetical protein AB1K54_16545 [Microbacterium sp. BWT-B31]|uniref:hypothetical protein n=1 Tax=Microbacterium sp. BWT-B31 TaxID=3232072 RepID=UPI0035279A1D
MTEPSDIRSFDDLAAPAASAISEALAANLLDQQIEAAWDNTHALFPDLDRPDVTTVRMVARTEWAQTILACMTDAGYSGRAVEDGSFQTGSIDPTIAPQYYTQLFVCKAEYPIDPRYLAPFNVEQIEYLYAYFRDQLAPCLEEHGYTPSKLPSFRTFSDGWTDESARWTPYADVIPTSESAWLELQQSCPQLPRSIY